MKTLLYLATASPATTHEPLHKDAAVLIAALAGMGLFLLGCWIMNKNRR